MVTTNPKKRCRLAPLLPVSLQAENLNLVQPDFETGAEALAEWLASPSCRLQLLDVSWNAIRGASAVALGASLARNASVQQLNLAYNGFGQDGGEALGVALLTNASLRVLDLASNAIAPRAAFVLASALLRNETLTRVVLDANPVGEYGGKVLLRLPIFVGDRLDVSLVGASKVGLHDASCWFHPENLLPETDFELALDAPYDRAVAFELLHLAAVSTGTSIPRCAAYDGYILVVKSPNPNDPRHLYFRHVDPALRARRRARRPGRRGRRHDGDRARDDRGDDLRAARARPVDLSRRDRPRRQWR